MSAQVPNFFPRFAFSDGYFQYVPYHEELLTQHIPEFGGKWAELYRGDLDMKTPVLSEFSCTTSSNLIDAVGNQMGISMREYPKEIGIALQARRDPKEFADTAIVTCMVGSQSACTVRPYFTGSGGTDLDMTPRDWYLNYGRALTPAQLDMRTDRRCEFNIYGRDVAVIERQSDGTLGLSGLIPSRISGFLAFTCSHYDKTLLFVHGGEWGCFRKGNVFNSWESDDGIAIELNQGTEEIIVYGNPPDKSH